MKIKVSYDSVDKEDFEPFIKRAYFENVYIKTSRKKPPAWIMDNRVPLSESELLKTASGFFIDLLIKTNIDQIATYGVGATTLLGSISAMAPFPTRTGIIRKEKKGKGRDRKVEGSLDDLKPILVIDDLVNSGGSVSRAIGALKDYGFSEKKISIAVLMFFDWGNKEKKLNIGKKGIPFYYAMKISRIKRKRKRKKQKTIDKFTVIKGARRRRT
jgi:orotate phosphoribosyltransferase